MIVELPKKLPSKREVDDEIKYAIESEPVLALPNYTKPFEVHTDVSNVAIGGVLMQDGHLVDYESRKLN
ncbi:hypothetical protein HRI_004001100 [Hibiscus trionum]|uniref:Reverse transcriptase/retrotransposon-derived protein RNase H-like domain-containing protein n=1 Tax=Hibiscus trionum TaxID=183268 RepID=A0A9W7IXZ6_HIBTR|nr:hypothetical protein HRI_004001100 [Hibiscus trionum]